MKRFVFSMTILTLACLISGGGTISGKSVQEESALNFSPAQAAPAIQTLQISKGTTGNKRYPAIAENGNGDRLIIFRGQDNRYWYSFCKKGSAWKTPVRIPDQPLEEQYWSTDMVVDSTGRFHCFWENPDHCVIYGSFLDGKWTAARKLMAGSRYDMGMSAIVRSNDQVVMATGQVVRIKSITKNIYFWYKNANKANFTYTNIIKDQENSCQPSISVDAKNHIWMAFKAEIRGPALDIRLLHYDQNNKFVEGKVLSDRTGWHFWPSTAINSEGKVMTVWAHSQVHDYWSRLYDPATKKLAEITPLRIGLNVRPWCSFWSRTVAYGKDFYAAVMNAGRTLFLFKYDEKKNNWIKVAQISKGGVDYFDMYAGKEQIMIAWGEFASPANIYVSTVDVKPVE